MSAILAAPFRVGSSNQRPLASPVVSGALDFARRAGVLSSMDARKPRDQSFDSLLPAGGWPFGSLIEIFFDGPSDEAIELLLPFIAKMTRENRRVAIIAPPYGLNSSVLIEAGVSLDRLVQIDADSSDLHWSAEQCLSAGGCAAVLQWLPQADYRQLRRLQQAAEASGTMAFVFRPTHVANQSSPAALRLKISRTETTRHIELIQQRRTVTFA